MELKDRARCAIVVLSLLAAACGPASATEADVGVGLPVDSAPIDLPAAPLTPTTTTPRSPTPTTTTSIAPDPFRTWIVTAKDHVKSLVAYEEPDGDLFPLPFKVPNPHQFGGPLTLMVTEGQAGDEWLKVQIPVRPNGRNAWIPAVDYDITSTRIRAEVVLSQTYVAVYDGDELIAETQAVIGAEDTPTPLGTFFVAAVRESNEGEGFLGPAALVLSGYSEVLESFSGGLPVIAIHGTNRPDQTGRAISFGCVRVPNAVITFLAEHMPLGAPVLVSA